MEDKNIVEIKDLTIEDFNTFTPTKEGLCIINKDGTGWGTRVFFDGKEIGGFITKVTIIIEPEEPLKAVLEVLPEYNKDCFFLEKIKPENISIVVKENKDCCKEK